MGRIDTTTNAALLQSGVMGGWNQYQQDRRFQLAQEQQALDQLRTLARIRAEDENLSMAMEDRALRARQYANQQRAILNLHKNLLSFGQSPTEAGGMAMAGEPGSFTNTLSGGQQAYRAAINPTASPLDGMSDEDFAALPEGLRSRLVGDDVEISRGFRAAKARFDQLRANGLLSRTSPQELKALADWGLLNNVSENELGPEGRVAAALGDEASRPALLDFLASDQTGQIDDGLRQRFSAMTTPELRKLTDRKMEAEDKAARERRDQDARGAEFDRLAANDPAMAELGPIARQSVRTAYQKDRSIPEWAATKAKPMEDRFTQARASNIEQDAKDDYNRAVKTYESFNLGDGKTLGLMPPTHSEIERVKHPAKTEWGDGISDMGEDEYATLKAKVDAWAKVQSAAQAVVKARAERDKMLSGGGGGNQAQPDKIDALISELLGR